MRADLEEGRITMHDYAVNRGYELFAPERLDARYRVPDDRHDKCGLGVIHLLRTEFDTFTPDEQDFFRRFAFRPSLPQSYVSPGGFFKLHYTTSGRDAVSVVDDDGNGIPDYIDEAALAFDNVHLLYTVTLGYQAPPADGIDGNEYDVYIEDLGFGFYGGTAPEGLGLNTQSYLIIDNDFVGGGYFTNGLDALRVTVAHEYHHMIQMGYIWRSEDRFFYEITATWFEDVVYDDVNDYFQYLPTLFQGSGFITNSTSNFSLPFTDVADMYGRSVWMHFLAAQFGEVTTHNTVRSMWEKMTTGIAINAIESTVNEGLPVSFEEAFHTFNTWNYFTGSRADTVNYYPEGRTYPDLVFNETLINANDTTFTVTNRELSTQYISVNRQLASSFALSLEAEIDDGGTWRVSTILSDNSGQTTVSGIPFFGLSANVLVTSFGNNPELVIVATNTTKFGKPGNFPLSVDLEMFGPVPLDANKLLPTIPSPANFSVVNRVKIPFIIVDPSDIEIKIYSISGALIKSFPRRTFSFPGLYENEFIWDGRNDNNERVPSGIYIYILKGDNFIHREKMAIIR